MTDHGLLSHREVLELLKNLPTPEALAIDFETTGLYAYKGAKAFIVGFAMPEHKGAFFLTSGCEEALKLLMSFKCKYLAHNAKFELSFLDRQFGIDPPEEIWDTEVFSRFENNNHRSHSLQNASLRLGLTKHEPLMEWLKESGKLHDDAPHELLIPYVIQDAYLSLLLYQHQYATFVEWQKSECKPGAMINLEKRTTRNLYKMERVGIRLDEEYCKNALTYESTRSEQAKAKFEQLSGKEFVDSALALSPILKEHGVEVGSTDAGNDSVAIDVLMKHAGKPLVDAILEYRGATKRATTYWKNLIELSHKGRIYPAINQARTATYRFSSNDPNCQNWPDDSDDPECKFPIRRALVADPECFIVSMDYAQMEYRLVADEAEDMVIVEGILNGVDTHSEISKLAGGVKRKLAKIVVFARLYGAGKRRISLILGIPEHEAQRICDAVDQYAPKIRQYCRALINQAKYSPYGYNFYGGRYFFDRGYEYKYPDYRIQGGCAVILRIAIDDIIPFLETRASHKTKLLIPIHDELVFNWHKDDLHLIPEVKQLMIMAHRNKKHLDMDVSISIGENFHDLAEFRNAV